MVLIVVDLFGMDTRFVPIPFRPGQVIRRFPADVGCAHAVTALAAPARFIPAATSSATARTAWSAP